ncbi:MAG: hypothetical protein ACLFN8_05140 [Candidatus Woesearchaeota archaeon]
MTWLILNRGAFSLLEKPLSAIGNIPSNYLLFFLGSSIIFYFVIIFLIKIYLLKNVKISFEIYFLPVLILLMLIIPYNDD